MTTQRCQRDHKRNRKLICMKSSIERQEQIWVVLSNYARHLNQIWFKKEKTTMAECATVPNSLITRRAFDGVIYLRQRCFDDSLPQSMKPL